MGCVDSQNEVPPSTQRPTSKTSRKIYKKKDRLVTKFTPDDIREITDE